MEPVRHLFDGAELAAEDSEVVADGNRPASVLGYITGSRREACGRARWGSLEGPCEMCPRASKRKRHIGA